MKATDSYSEKVSNYIKEEYGESILSVLLHPDVADVAIMNLIIHEQSGISIQDTAITLVNYIKNKIQKTQNEY